MIDRLLHALAVGTRWVRRNYSWLLPAVAIILMIFVAIGVNAILTQQHDSQLESCARGNESRVATVDNLRSDRHKAELELAKERRVEERYPLMARSDYIAFLPKYIRGKERTIHRTIASQKTVAVRPGSPVVSCQRAYP